MATTYLRRMEPTEPGQNPPCPHAVRICLNQHELTGSTHTHFTSVDHPLLAALQDKPRSVATT